MSDEGRIRTFTPVGLGTSFGYRVVCRDEKCGLAQPASSLHAADGLAREHAEQRGHVVDVFRREVPGDPDTARVHTLRIDSYA